MSCRNYLIVFVTVCLSCSMAQLNVDQLKTKYASFVLECAGENKVEMADVQELVKHNMPEKENVKCMLACFLKKIGMTDEEGRLSEENVKKIAESVYANKPELMEKSAEFVKTCLPANDIEISGDKKECTRAAMIFKCSVDHGSAYNGENS